MPNAEKIMESLIEHNIGETIIQQIMEGYEALPTKCKKEQKAAFITQVIARMDEILNAEVSSEIIDWCACCKGGIREKNIKKFVKENKEKSLSEKITGLNDIPNMGNPILNKDGTISCEIVWEVENRYKCPCPNYNGLQLKESVSITYCRCCAGHFRHHYQNALGVKLKTKGIVSSVLESLGEKPCRFVFEIVE